MPGTSFRDYLRPQDKRRYEDPEDRIEREESEESGDQRLSREIDDEDRPNTHPFKLRPKHPLLHNVGFRMLAEGFQELAIHCRRMLQRWW